MSDIRDSRSYKLEVSMTNHKPDQSQVKKIERLRNAYKELGMTIINSTSNSRESSIAINELESSLAWAIKSIILEGVL